LVAVLAGLIVLLVVLLDLRLFDTLTLLFDSAFVLVCTAAALAVRPRDFFMVGVLPPLLMAATIGVLAVMSGNAISDPGDGLLQTVVSGLAHHAGALVTGYALTLAVLALRQVALRNAGTIRALGRSRPARATGHGLDRATGHGLDPATGHIPDQGTGHVPDASTGHVPDQAGDSITGERLRARSSR
jgi:hypothetical protein